MAYPPAILLDPARLAALDRLGLRDPSTTAAFERLTRLATHVIHAPVALVSLVEADRQRFAGCIGLPEPWASQRESPLSHSFCQHVVAAAAPLVIEDARLQPLVLDNLAIQDLGVVAYAGMPLLSSDGHVLGSFCVIDHVPRRWTPDELATLADLTASVLTEIELRSAILERRTAEHALHQLNADLEGLVVERTARLATANAALQAEVQTRTQSERRLAAFAALAQHLSGAATEHAAAQLIAETAATLIGWDRFCLARFPERADHLHPVLALHVVDEQWVVAHPTPPPRDDAQGCESLRAAAAHLLALQPTCLTASAARTNGGEQHAADGLMLLPIGCDRAPLGLIALWTANPDGYPPHQHDILRALGDLCTETLNRMRAETMQRMLEAQLMQAQKLESIGRLAGGIAHDFNNLLTAIVGFADLASALLDAEHPVQADLQEIGKVTRQAAALTRQLLTMARRQPLTPAVVNLSFVLHEMDQLLAHLLGDQIELVLELADDLASIVGDRGQLEQVIVNLAVNARDAMPTGGSLRIGTMTVQLPAELAQPCGLATGTYVQLTVSDIGCGMTPEVQQHLFEPFFTTKGPDQGTGLGLATSYGIVAQHQGTITVASTPGQGTTFTVYLPVGDHVVVAAPAPTARASAAAARGSETVLIAEDDAAVRNLAARTLRAHGYQVLTAANGDEALGVHLRTKEAIHLLLTDVTMPRVDGHTLATHLIRRQPGLKILYMSGDMDHPLVAAIQREAPGSAWLPKPFAPDILATTVRELLDQ